MSSFDYNKKLFQNKLRTFSENKCFNTNYYNNSATAVAAVAAAASSSLAAAVPTTSTNAIIDLEKSNN